MARFLYLRASTEIQGFMQQMNTIKEYFARMGMDINTVAATYQEKESGTVSHNDRKLAALIAKCEKGDSIYVSELSRLGRNMSDLFALVSETSAKGITIIQCKDGTQIENESIGGKAILFALSLAAEIEVKNLRQRTQSALNAIKANIKENGTHVSKSGRVITHLGSDKGCDTSAARVASISSKRARAEEWRRTNIGYNAVRRWVYEGRSNEDIIAEFNHFHELQPDNFCTPKGCALTEGTLKVWRREFQLLKDVI